MSHSASLYVPSQTLSSIASAGAAHPFVAHASNTEVSFDDFSFRSSNRTKSESRWLSEFHHLCYLTPTPQDMWPKGHGSLHAGLASSGPIVDDSQHSTDRGSPPRSDSSCELSRKLV